MKRYFTLSIIIIFLTIGSNVFSKSGFQNFIPNGQVNTCLNCHFSINGGARNLFGKAAENSMSNDRVRWEKIFNLDSDGDGFTNGEELQDSKGVWTIGQTAPENASLVTNPGDPTSKPTVSFVENESQSYNSTIYPIPTNGVINLEFISDYFDKGNLEIYNSNGDKIYYEIIDTKIGSNKLMIDLNNPNVNNGIYFLILRNKYFDIKKRIVISK
jgi:hypothetical protein